MKVLLQVALTLEEYCQSCRAQNLSVQKIHNKKQKCNPDFLKLLSLFAKSVYVQTFLGFLEENYKFVNQTYYRAAMNSTIS